MPSAIISPKGISQTSKVQTIQNACAIDLRFFALPCCHLFLAQIVRERDTSDEEPSEQWTSFRTIFSLSESCHFHPGHGASHWTGESLQRRKNVMRLRLGLQDPVLPVTNIDLACCISLAFCSGQFRFVSLHPSVLSGVSLCLLLAAHCHTPHNRFTTFQQ